jgi:hypothetical protein
MRDEWRRRLVEQLSDVAGEVAAMTGMDTSGWT